MTNQETLSWECYQNRDKAIVKLAKNSHKPICHLAFLLLLTLIIFAFFALLLFCSFINICHFKFWFAAFQDYTNF